MADPGSLENVEVEVEVSGRRQRKHLKKTCLGCDNEDVISFWLSQEAAQVVSRFCAVRGKIMQISG